MCSTGCPYLLPGTAKQITMAQTHTQNTQEGLGSCMPLSSAGPGLTAAPGADLGPLPLQKLLTSPDFVCQLKCAALVCRPLLNLVATP